MIKDSPFQPLKVSPTNLYGPNCVTVGIPTTTFAGTEYTFKIQARDFYQNNIRQTLSDATDHDHEVVLSLIPDESDIDFKPLLVQATIVDDTASDLGVYLVSFTTQKSGDYKLDVKLRGQEVPLENTLQSIKVHPVELTLALTSNYTGI